MNSSFSKLVIFFRLVVAIALFNLTGLSLPAAIVPAGVDLDRGEYLRTTTSSKPLDGDGDNVYGTAGYVFFATEALGGPSGFWSSVLSPAANLTQLPSFVSGIGVTSGINFYWGYSYSAIDNPTLTPSGAVANLESGVILTKSQYEQSLASITLSGTVPANFRIGIVVDNGSLSDLPSRLRITSSNGDASAMFATSPGNSVPDVYFFNVSGAQAGNVLTIKVTRGSVGGGIAGIVFDLASTAPPTLTQLLTGATVTLNDEFTGTSLNSATWSAGMRWAGVINNEPQAYRAENVSVANGVCTITTLTKSGAINHAGGYPVGSTVLAVDGLTSALPVGASLRITSTTTTSDNIKWYSILSSVGGSTPTQVTVTPSLAVAVNDNDRLGTAPMQDWVGYQWGAFEYSSGAIQTYNKFAQTYGYFEARVKMAAGTGTWPAFWLIPDRGASSPNEWYRTSVGNTWNDGNGNSGSCPMGNEMDVFEYMNFWKSPSTGLSKSHSGYFWGYAENVADSIGDFTMTTPDQLLTPDTQYHTYGILWQPGTITFYVDSNPVWTRTDPTTIGVCPHYLILNTAISFDTWTGTTLTPAQVDAGLPSSMVIDYVKAYTLSTSSAPVANGTYRLTPRNSSYQSLDVNGVSLADGANAQTWTYGGGNNQKWALTHISNGIYEIKAVHSGKCLDVNGGGSGDGTNVQQWTDNDSVSQRWKVQPTDGGYYRLIPQTNTNSALEVSGAGYTNGSNVDIWTYSGGTHQQWKIETP